MSGYTDRSLRLGDGIDFISKPIRPEALLKKVRTVLDA
jgi:DNA-binding response OmpR family regulator